MSCSTSVYDKNGKEIFAPDVYVSQDHTGIKYTTTPTALVFLDKVKEELGVNRLSDADKIWILKKHWRHETLTEQERAAINIDWLDDIVSSDEFGYLVCC